MVLHTCPLCGRGHEVREARAQVAYGRQFTCSPECESERRRRRRYHPRALPPVFAERKRAVNRWQGLRAGIAQSLHQWVVAAAGADLVRAAAWTRSIRGGTR